jgi:folate-binding protein YgfZ
MGDTDLRTELGAAPLVRDVVLVHGPEAATYLQGQLSQDVEALAVGASAPTLLLQPTGKVDAWLRLTRTGDDAFALDVDAGWGEAVAARLRRFKLRTKAEVELATWHGFAVRGPGAAAVVAGDGGTTVAAGWPGVDGVDVFPADGAADDAASLLPPDVAIASAAALDALRIECGVPAMGSELTDATIPAEAGQWLIDASVSFTKGCYTGQELVARVDSRGGNVPRPLRGLLLDDDAPVGASVVAVGSPEDAAPVGTVTSVARSADLGAVALATVGRAVEIGAAVEVRWSGGQVRATVAGLPLR